MSVKRKSDAQELLQQARAQNPHYWAFLEQEGLVGPAAARADHDPFLVTTPNRLTFSVTYPYQLILTQSAAGSPWNCADPTLPATVAGIRRRLLTIWQHRIHRIESHLIQAVSNKLNEYGRRNTFHGADLNAALAQQLAGPPPDFKALAQQVYQLLNPEAESPGTHFAGRGATVELNDYCRRFHPELAAIQDQLGPIVLQFWLKEAKAQEPPNRPPTADQVEREAKARFREKQGRQPKPRPEHWLYFALLPFQLHNSNPPPEPGAVAELCELLNGQRPHPELYQRFAQRQTHALRWIRLKKEHFPAAAAWLQWLNHQLQAAPEPPNPQLLVTLSLVASANPENATAVRDVLASAPANGPALQQAFSQRLNHDGHARPTPAANALKQQEKERQQGLADAIDHLRPQLEAQLPPALDQSCQITAQPDGSLHYSRMHVSRTHPWLAKTGLSPEQQQAEAKANTPHYHPVTALRELLITLLRAASPEWSELSPEAAQLSWQQLCCYDRDARHWLDRLLPVVEKHLQEMSRAAQNRADPGLLAVLSGLLAADQPLTLPMYNAALAGGAAWTEALTTNPGAAAWWLASPKPRPPVNHPGQIIQAAKAELRKAGSDR